MKPVRATWGRCLVYGLVSGTVAFAALLLAVGLLPVGDGGAALFMYVALVVPPALAARRFAPGPTAKPRTRRALRPASAPKPEPGPEPKSRPRAGARPGPERAADAARAAEQAVTSYGELLRLHPYSPRPSDDPDDLADYRTALEAYEEAGQSPPSRVPEILERGRAALERLDLAARATDSGIQWIHGSGRTRVRAPRPATDGPALLVFETDQEHGVYSVFIPRPTRWREPLKGECGPGLTRGQVLVPAQRGAHTELEVWADGPWRLALRPAAEARRLCWNAPLRGRGIETVVKAGGSRVVEFEHHGDGRFGVRSVTRSFDAGRPLADGQGPARLAVAVPERCVLRVESTGRWSLRDPGA